MLIAVLYPTGGEIGLIGIWKAMRELEALGWLKGLPARLIAVQAEGCRPVVDAWERRADRDEIARDPRTVASGRRVPLLFVDTLLLRAVRETDGKVVAESQPIRSDGVAQRPLWKDRKDLAAWVGKPIRLRFTLRYAKLFAFQVVGKVPSSGPR